MKAERLKKLRQSRNLSQVEMAEALGFGSKEIWRYENGESVPSAEKIARIAQFLNVSIDYLMGLSDETVMHESDLSDKERRVISLWRNGERIEAVRIIASE